jgi:hypothetical protein
LKWSVNFAVRTQQVNQFAFFLLQIDFQETFAENRLSIQKGIDDQLDKRKWKGGIDNIPIESLPYSEGTLRSITSRID